MQKIRSLIPAAACLLLTMAPVPVSAGTAKQLVVSTAELEKCFELNEGLERLTCYDNLLKKPISSTHPAPPPVTIATQEEKEPAILKQARALLNSPFRHETGAAITLLERQTGRELGAESHALLESEGEEYDTLLRTADLAMAFPSRIDIGEPATLIIACRSNITELQLVWERPFDRKIREVRIYAGTTLTDSAGERQPMRSRAQGYMLEAPRGLDSIALIRQFVSGQLMQAAVESGNAPRSAFFDMKGLRDVLPLQARFCSWKTTFEG